MNESIRCVRVCARMQKEERERERVRVGGWVGENFPI